MFACLVFGMVVIRIGGLLGWVLPGLGNLCGVCLGIWFDYWFAGWFGVG